MARIFSTLLLLVVLLTGCSQTGQNGNATANKYKIDIDGTQVTLPSQPPVFTADDVMIPYTVFNDSFGTMVHAQYTESDGTIAIDFTDALVNLHIGQDSAVVYQGNPAIGQEHIFAEKTVKLQDPPRIINGTPYVPLKATVENSRYHCELDTKNKSAFVNSGELFSGTTYSIPVPSNTGPVVLTHSPLDLEAFTVLGPIGAIQPPNHTQPSNHMYFEDITQNGTYKIYAPADGIIIGIDWVKMDWDKSSGHTGQYDDYGMLIRYSNTFYTMFAHVAQIADSVLAQSGDLILDTQYGLSHFKAVNIPVKAGDVIGYQFWRLPSRNLDMFAIDYNVTVNFIEPSHHQESLHNVCPLDYFNDTVRAMLLSKDPRTIEPRGGTFLYDKAGTLAGDWYLGGLSKYSEGDWQDSLVFGYDYKDPSIIRLGIGGNLATGMGLFCVSGNAPDPASVTGGSGTVVYKLKGTPSPDDTNILYTMIVQITGAESIKVEAFPGDVASPQFTDKALTYVR